MKTYIDTLGAQDPELGKTINLDSVKLMLNTGRQSMKEQQILLREYYHGV